LAEQQKIKGQFFGKDGQVGLYVAWRNSRGYAAPSVGPDLLAYFLDCADDCLSGHSFTSYEFRITKQPEIR
jgi:hypothetical protein